MTVLPVHSATGPATPARRTRACDLPDVRWAAASLAAFVLGLIADIAAAPDWVWWTLYLVCYAAGGWGPGLDGLRMLRGRALDVDLLMVLAALGAASIGQVRDGALLIVIFATSGALESVATARTADSVRGLMDVAPERAELLGADGLSETVAADTLTPGDTVLIRPGERIAADGTVVDGASEVDQAAVTGEPLPVDRAVGDTVFAGTLNGTGSLTVRVDRPAAETVVARIAEMVAQASRTKARTQLFIERVEQRYSVAMVVCTLAVFGLPLAFGDDARSALLRAMTFMIVASPCAVVLATMPPLLASIAHAGRRGVLVKSTVVMEKLADVDVVAFDKTGTVTLGRPVVVSVDTVGPMSADDVLGLAAAVERHSEHPLSAAIVDAARVSGPPAVNSRDFVALPGRGVSATIDGRRVDVTSPSQGLALAAARSRAPVVVFVGAIEERGDTAILVLVDDVIVGVLAVSDTVRPEAEATVTALDGAAVDTVLLTGDNRQSARLIGERIGVADVRAELLPEDKTAAIDDLRDGGRRIAMVGDGVNDAPALASADVGVAMGGAGSDLALHAADVVIVGDDLALVPETLAFARRVRRTVVVNLAIAGTFIVALVAWDLIGTLPLPLGVAGHEGSTIVVAMNGLRLLRTRAWPRS